MRFAPANENKLLLLESARSYFRCQASVTFLIRSLQPSLTNVNARLSPLVLLNLYTPGPLQPFAALPPASWIVTVSPVIVRLPQMWRLGLTTSKVLSALIVQP